MPPASSAHGAILISHRRRVGSREEGAEQHSIRLYRRARSISFPGGEQHSAHSYRRAHRITLKWQKLPPTLTALSLQLHRGIYCRRANDRNPDPVHPEDDVEIATPYETRDNKRPQQPAEPIWVDQRARVFVHNVFRCWTGWKTSWNWASTAGNLLGLRWTVPFCLTSR